MAYGISGQAEVMRFSDPQSQQCMGVACGVAGQADNVRSINLMAGHVSRLRDPLGTISIRDARVFEDDLGSSRGATLVFDVRLSSPAPAGGVRFDVAVVAGGTATPGVDFTSASAVGQVIAAGQRDATFEVAVLPDTVIEPD